MVLTNINNHTNKCKIIIFIRAVRWSISAYDPRIYNKENGPGQGVRDAYSLVSTIQPTEDWAVRNLVNLTL